MQKSRILTGVAAAALIIAAPAALTSNGAGLSPVPPAQAQVQISFGIFYDRLADHGYWVRYEPYGFVWIPTVVSADWAPYTHGRWIYTDRFGWYFVSDEPFAWAAYHYGRWGFDPDIGWFWVPGTTWAPAWVAWRAGPDYVGWAPLPPRRDGVRFTFAVDFGRRDIPPPYWHFVPVRQFVAPRLETVIVRGYRQPALFQQTLFAGPVHVEGDLVVNQAIEVNYIEQHIQQNVVVHNVQAVEDPDMAVTAQIEGDTIQVFQADVAEAPDAEPPQVMEVQEAAAEAPTAMQVDEAEMRALEESPEFVEEPAELPAEFAEDPPIEEAPAVAEEPAEPAPDVAEEPTVEPELEAAEEPTAEPELEAAEEPTAAPELEAAEEPTAEPELEAAEEPTAEPELEAAEEPTAEPTEPPAAEAPAVEEAPEVAEEPAEPAPEVAEEPPVEEAPEAAEVPPATGEAEERPALEIPPEPEPEATEPAPLPEPQPEAAPEPQQEELLPQQQ
jgi:hypothetical protein